MCALSFFEANLSFFLWPAVKRLGPKDWSSSLKKVATFDVVEDFWGVFNNVRPPSRLNGE
jgi:hypothetical protein